MWDDFVSFYLGCSFTFEIAMVENGIDLAHVRMKKVVSMFSSNIALESVGPFNGRLTVSMRMIAKSQLEKAFMISSQYPLHHGAPIHIGDPSRIGINDVMKPDEGDPPVEVCDEDIPVFWGCGVTQEKAITNAS